jgi:hypothetical protein
MDTLIQYDMTLVNYRFVVKCRNVTEMTLAEHLLYFESSPTQTTVKRWVAMYLLYRNDKRMYRCNK